MLKRCSNLCKEIICNPGLMFLPFYQPKVVRWVLWNLMTTVPL